MGNDSRIVDACFSVMSQIWRKILECNNLIFIKFKTVTNDFFNSIFIIQERVIF